VAITDRLVDVDQFVAVVFPQHLRHSVGVNPA
jgi:hypothetical protein